MKESTKFYWREKLTDLSDWFRLLDLKFKVYLIGAVIILAVLASGWITATLENLYFSAVTYFQKRELEKANEADGKTIDDLKKEVPAVKDDIEDLKRQAAEKSGELNNLNANYNVSVRSTDNARAAANQAVTNARQTEKKTYQNIPLEQAEKSRCLAFPESCRK